ncbi:MAG TPA: DUF5908 family protein [Prolixibacteraceae bacterium]|nr:DUF5908 family protein [Prolixibacteraceae bacterium]
MPIKIEELHIKINVDENAQPPNRGGSLKKEKDKIIAACVEQVMEILSKKEER